MRATMTTATILILTTLAGCLEVPQDEPGPAPPAMDPDRSTDPAQVARGNDRLFFHSQGADLWMDTTEQAGDAGIDGQGATNGADTWYTFDMRPTTARNLTLSGDPASITVLTDDAGGAGTGPELRVRLSIDGEQVAQANSGGQSFGGTITLEVGVPESIPRGATISVGVCVCAVPTSGVYSYTLRTGGQSYLTLPVQTPYYEAEGTEPAPEDNEPAPPETNETSESGQVTTRESNGVWYAERTDTFIDDDVGSPTLDVELRTVNGAVDVHADGQAGYAVNVFLQGKGSTEQEARDRLSELRVSHEASSGLVVKISKDDNRWNNHTANIEAHLSQALVHPKLDVHTVNGRLEISGVEAGDVTAGLTNGDVEIQDAIVTGDVDVGTTNGDVDIRVDVRGSGTIDASNVNGGVSVHVPDDAEHGYDASAATVNGEATIDLSDTEPQGAQSRTSKHERTQDFDMRTFQTTIRVSTTNGFAEISG